MAPLPDELVDAIVLRMGGLLFERPKLALAVGPGQTTLPGLSWFGTGLAPPDTPLPYATYAEPDEADDPWDTSGSRAASGTINIQVFSSTKKQARGLGDQVEQVLQTAADSGGLAIARGHLFRFYQSGRSALLDPDSAEDGGDCWIETRQFTFHYTY